MPLKQRAKYAPDITASSRRSGSSYEIRTFKASCNKDAVIIPNTVDISRTSGPLTYVESWERIRYDNSQYKKFNICHHLKAKSDAVGHFGITMKDHWCITTNYPYYSCYSPISITKMGDIDLSVRLPSSTWSTLGLDFGTPSSDGTDPFLPVGTDLFNQKVLELDRLALDDMIPKLDSGFSIPVFIYELFDIKQLIRTVRHFLTEGVRGILRRFAKKPLRHLSHSWLEAIFGWLPFVRDIKKIYTIFWEVGKQVEDYIFNSGHRLTYHWRKALNPTMWGHPSSWFSSSGQALFTTSSEGPLHYAYDVFNYIGCNTLREREILDYEYHATMEFQYWLPMLSAFARQFLGELDYWGLHLSLSDIWAVIPFSFVVDWVFDIGSWLERFDRNHLPAQVMVYDFARSFNYHMRSKVKVTGLTDVQISHTLTSPYDAYPKGWAVDPCYESAERSLDSYYRVPGIPVPSAEQLPNLRFPSGMQWVTAAALSLR